MTFFEQASIQKIRFPSVRGELTTEQLWDLPLQSKNQFDLDTVAKEVNASLKAVTEESFVNTITSPAKSKYELMLELVKHVIAFKLKANEEARTKADKAAKKDKLVAILGEKQDEALKALTPDELVKQIAELS
jgi:hypothetical protein